MPKRINERYGPGLGRAIRTRRLALGLRQVDLAARLGVSQAAISDLEIGRVGMPARLDDVATALDWTVGELWDAAGHVTEDLARIKQGYRHSAAGAVRVELIRRIERHPLAHLHVLLQVSKALPLDDLDPAGAPAADTPPRHPPGTAGADPGRSRR